MSVADGVALRGPALVREDDGPCRFGARVHTSLESAEAAWMYIEAQGHCTPFQRLDWARTIVAHGVGTTPSAVFVIEIFDRAGTSMLLLPLTRRSRGFYSSLEWLGADVCDYCAPLFTTKIEWTPLIALAAWRAARKVLPRADLLRIDHLPPRVDGVVNPLLLLGRNRISKTETCGVRVHGDPQTVLERCCDASFVKKLGKTGRRLAARGMVRFVEARSEAEVEEIFGALLQQRLSRFRKLDRFDLISEPGVAAFYRAAALQGLRGGAVRLLGLRVGDQWVGTYYGLKHGGAFQGLIVTIADERWKNCSPGLHVHAHVIRWVSAQGLAYFDMSVGSASYKDQIGGQRSVLHALDRALSLRGHLILLAIHAVAAVKGKLRERPKLHGLVGTLIGKVERFPRKMLHGRRARFVSPPCEDLPGGQLRAAVPGEQ